ncbi:zinc-binding dehydrogenase [Deinococcus sp. SDU3-2]|uniref:Zinc-binding dehydrogenase n=1 Tax=Deinococcus terrestris TaxID=2651870 RepID=A0A7X1NY88_9DEIO|nr:zinc-binding dehydrogenase [Deinococcus terrestris]
MSTPLRFLRRAGGVILGSTANDVRAWNPHTGQPLWQVGAGDPIGPFAVEGSTAVFTARLGAEAIDHTREDFAARALELTGNQGVDVILDTVGGETLGRGLTCLAPFGRLVTFGGSGGGAARVAAPLLHRTNRAVVGYSSGHLRRTRPAAVGELARQGLELLASGTVRLQIGARFALPDAAAAHDLMESRASQGKVLLALPEDL